MLPLTESIEDMTSHKRKELEWWHWCLIGVGVVVTVFVLWLVLGSYPRWSKATNEAGLFGDSYGYINSLFSGLAFALLIVTLLMQHIELKYQRQELTETKEQFKQQTKAQQDSEKRLFLSAYVSANEALNDLAELHSKNASETQQLQALLIQDELYHKLYLLTDELDLHAIQLFPSLNKSLSDRSLFNLRMELLVIMRGLRMWNMSDVSVEHFQNKLNTLYERVEQYANTEDFDSRIVKSIDEARLAIGSILKHSETQKKNHQPIDKNLVAQQFSTTTRCLRDLFLNLRPALFG